MNKKESFVRGAPDAHPTEISIIDGFDGVKEREGRGGKKDSKIRVRRSTARDLTLPSYGIGHLFLFVPEIQQH